LAAAPDPVHVQTTNAMVLGENGRVFVADNNIDHKIVAIDGASGAVAWSAANTGYNHMYSTDDGGVVLDGNFFFGSEDARIDGTGQASIDPWTTTGDYRELQYAAGKTWYGFRSWDFALASIDPMEVSGSLDDWRTTLGFFSTRAAKPILEIKYDDNKCAGFDDPQDATGQKEYWLMVPSGGANTVNVRIAGDLSNLEFTTSDAATVQVSPAVPTNHRIQLTVSTTAPSSSDSEKVFLVYHAFAAPPLPVSMSIPIGSISLAVKTPVNRTVYPFAVSQQAANGQVTDSPNRLPNTAALQAELESVYGKQANFHFTVFSTTVLSGNYDLNGDHKLAVPTEGATSTTSEMVALFTVIGNDACPAPPAQPKPTCDPHGFYATYVHSFDRTYPGVTPNGFPAFMQDSHQDSTELLTTHELGHSLKLDDICPGDTSLATVQACLSHQSRDQERIMWHIDGTPNRCRLTKKEWDIVNP